MLKPRSVIGTFEVLAPLGVGGMGEVWRARDMKLQREVAIKVLPDDFSSDPERLIRFQREAQTLASLNHPNIAAIYEVVEDGRTQLIVLELVDGETLAERIRRGPVLLEEALAIAEQIADAVEAAHERGIVHRDLKPANIKITPKGKVKVLDFGLAKISDPTGGTASLSQAPTVVMGSSSGVILGTPAYLSPEQARGKPVDKRTDIWAFGCVLYEMLTGRQAFTAETMSDLFVAILTRDVDWQALPAVPEKVRELLARCLQKDPTRRLRDIGDARISIEEAMATPTQSQGPDATAIPKRVPRTIWILAIVVAFAAGLGVMRFGGARSGPHPTWSGTQLVGPRIAMMPRVSPDGHLVAFHVMVDGQTQLAVKHPDSGDWTELTHDRTRGFLSGISWSPDGTRIYYGRSDRLPRGVFSVPAVGGEERLVLEDARNPEALPDGSLLVVRANEKRQYQIFRFWPENNRLDPYPGIVIGFVWGAPRAFRDGKQAVFWGRSTEQLDTDPNSYLYALDLDTAKIRRISTNVVLPSQWALGVSADDQSIVAAANSADLNTIVEIPRNGGAAREISSMTHTVWGLDVAANGDLYFDQPNKFLEVLLMESDGGKPQTILTANTFMEMPSIPLPDGRMLYTGSVSGRSVVFAAKAQGNPTAFIQTTEETSGPITMIGSSEVAFRIGSAATRKLAIASIADGRIVRRLEKADAAPILALAGSADGRTLYYAAAGKIWAIPSNDGQPSLIREGDSVAVDPSGQYLIVQLNERENIRLVRVPLKGGAEQALSFPDVRLVGTLPFNAVRADGAIIKTVAFSDSYPDQPAVLIPGTGKARRIPLPSFLDTFSAGWTVDGQIVVFGQQLNDTIWRLRPVRRQQ